MTLHVQILRHPRMLGKARPFPAAVRPDLPRLVCEGQLSWSPAVNRVVQAEASCRADVRALIHAESGASGRSDLLVDSEDR
jgi:hypothetical protein